MKLTPTQRAALAAMPFQCTTWGGKPFSRPKGAGSIATWKSLQKRGLASCKRQGFTDCWTATAAGRAALETLANK